MINQPLLEFIKEQLQKGISKDIISTELTANGWNAQDLEEAFRAIPPIPAPAPAPIPAPITPTQTGTPSNINLGSVQNTVSNPIQVTNIGQAPARAQSVNQITPEPKIIYPTQSGPVLSTQPINKAQPQPIQPQPQPQPQPQTTPNNLNVYKVDEVPDFKERKFTGRKIIRFLWILLVIVIAALGLYYRTNILNIPVVKNILGGQTTSPVTTAPTDVSQESAPTLNPDEETPQDTVQPIQEPVQDNTGSSTSNNPPSNVSTSIPSKLANYKVLCKDDLVCQKYFDIWKIEQLSRNHYTEAYFNSHIIPESMEIQKWNTGESFDITYAVNIDWAFIKATDSFLVKLNPSEDTFKSLNIPKDVYLTKSSINVIIDKLAFSSQITLFKPIDHLFYKSQDDVLNTLATKEGAGFQFSDIRFITNNPITENSVSLPMLIALNPTNCSKNEQKIASVNLMTGEIIIKNDVCSMDLEGN